MTNLESIRVAVVAADGVEETEITEPLKALREAGQTGALGLDLNRQHPAGDDGAIPTGEG